MVAHQFTHASGAPAPSTLVLPHARDGLASTNEACAYLRVSRQFLWVKTRSGQIQPVRLGRLTRFRWADLQSIAESGFPPPAEARANHGGAK